MDVLIVGGGLGGVAAAVALRRAGIEAEVFEQTGELREIGAGLSVWPNATHVLADLGLLGAARARSGEIRRLELRDPFGALLSTVEMPGRFPTPSLCIHRADLLALLARELPETQLHLGKRFESFEERDDRIVARFSDGDQVESRVLVGADGLFSRVRTALFGTEQPVYRGCHGWRGLAPIRHGLGETAIEFWGPGRRIGIEPMGPERIFWYATENAPHGSIGAPESWRARLAQLFEGWDQRALDAIQHTPQHALLCHDLYDRPPRASWSRGRATLLGDAAHPTTPYLGQGACMALEDAYVLARCIAKRGATVAALRHFKCERIVRTSMITMQSRHIGWLGQWQRPSAVALRTALLKSMPRFVYELQHWMLYRGPMPSETP